MSQYNCSRCGMNQTKESIDDDGKCVYCGSRFATGVVTDGSKPFTKNQIVILKNDLYGGEYKKGSPFIFLGEVVQMDGHCIVVDRKGNTLWGMHTENFRAPKCGEI